MTSKELLVKVKLLADIDTQDDKKDRLLLLLIEQAIEEAKNYTHNTNITALSGAICQMVMFRYNLLDTQGITSENYSGVAFNYAVEYPKYILDNLRSHRKIIVG